MRYGILGTTSAHSDDGRPLALGGARLRALLAALALRPGRSQSVPALIDAVWDGEPPADATGALQALVGRLRRAVGPEAVASAPGGYRLCAEPDDVDLHRFERLADEGERALADGDPAKAVVLLDDALALWRGPALADLPGAGAAAAARPEAHRLAARRARLAATVALGDAAGALPALAGLCAEHPLDEPLHALRLRALRAAGRPAEALAAYEAVRRHLADRLGTEPGPELRALHTELLAPEAEAGSAPPVTSVVADRHGEHPAPADPAVPDKAHRGNLRARLTSFVGREDDLVRIREDLTRHRLVTLLGPGGAGKTRLSQEAAETAAGPWPDGVWFAELAPVDDPATVPEAVLTALGARETVVRGTTAEGLRAATDATALDPLARVAEHCERRRMLLVLDNCEHVVDAAARLAETLLAHCPGVTVLATSREPLAVPGEAVRPVEPLPDPVALRLLDDRGAAARPGFRSADDPEACAEICRRLDGLPLAIELAAARLRGLTPRMLADRLDDRFRLLTSGSRTVLPRQQTLRAVVDWSWDLLDDPERAVLRRLAVFAGGCDLSLAEEVCADGTAVTAPDVAALMGSLVDKSLVVAVPTPDGEMRYRLLETVGEYAAERLEEAGERAGTAHRHLVAFRELARTADPALRGPRQRAWLDRLELEHDNLRTALRHAVARGDEQEALCLVLSLGWFWQLRDHRADARHWSEAAAGLGPDPFAEPVEPARPLFVSCTAEPPPMAGEVLKEARRGVRLLALANAESDMRVVYTPEVQRRLRGVVAAYGGGQPQNCRVPGMMWFFALLLTGAVDDLCAVTDRTVERCRELGYTWELANALQLRAKLLNEQPERAREGTRDADESLEIFTRLGDAWGVAEALSSRAEAHQREGRFLRAAEDYRAAIERVRALGSEGQVPHLSSRLTDVLLEAGAIDLEEGERRYREALEAMEKDHPDAAAFVHVQLGILLARKGHVAEARRHFDHMSGEFGARQLALFEGMVLGLTAWLDILDGRPEEALPKLREGLAKVDGDPLVHLVASHLPSVHLMTAAYAHARTGGREHDLRAARLLGASVAQRPTAHFVVTHEREVRERTTELARAALGPQAYERAYDEGARLSPTEAAALV
ncbi:BTAD domain-containing putative transcriptional regulator [Streptomyces sp. UNOB3_S3]|uniref:ATP-binding protein n=1 Tax=Streptomyces sp. UNOB3_S3 TaxID=2871682 RepID=UPI001E443A8B|nr:BTAD domain-containing putative transcriptional regulator [Streptomyces sp. UNOB3_S3]MCC3777461.1 winged helix-turn-helix domain-containing protein [Streptomyces sp. UNOB3_S3]